MEHGDHVWGVVIVWLIIGLLIEGSRFKTTCCHFETWAILFTRLCLSLLEETLKAAGPFYLVSMTGEVKDPMQGNGKKYVVDSLTLEKNTLK